MRRVKWLNPQLVINKLKNLSRKHRIVLFSILLSVQIVITAIVYLTGGIQYVYSHSMYIPVIFASLIFGHKTGIFFALIGGLLLGPFMPINTETGLMQNHINWIYRTVFFIFVSFTTGIFSEHTNMYYLDKIKQLTFLGESDIQRINILASRINKLSNEEKKDYRLAMIKVNNRDSLIDLFGADNYLNLLMNLANSVKASLENTLGVYARNLDGLIVCYSKEFQTDYIEKLSSILLENYEVDGIQIFIKISIGITELTNDLDEAINQASIASNDAFESNKEYKLYSGEIAQKSRNLKILGSVVSSIKNNDFYLVFQPKIDFKTTKCIGAECLLRWNHPILGNIPPNEFIPIIEKTTLINTLTEWILNSVISLLKEHKDKFNPLDYPIAINLSTASISSNHPILNSIINVIEDAGLGTKILQFEITESLLMDNPQESINFVNQLNDYGISFSIDDFGTGYSSLEYLSQFAVQEIKIDRIFISRMLKSKDDLSLVKTTINLARALHIKTVAEGVETEEEANTLIGLKCDYAQGYYYAKPMSFLSLIDYISDERKKSS